MANRRFLFPSLLLLVSFSIFGQQSNFIRYTVKDGLPVSTVLSLEQDSRNYLWIGTEGGGISRFDGSAFTSFNTKHGLAGNSVWSILETSNGDLLMGTDNGLTIYDGFSFTTLKQELDLSRSAIIGMMEDHNKQIWLCTDRDGLRRIRREQGDTLQVDRITETEGLLSPYVSGVTEDRYGRIWAATAGGIYVITENEKGFQVRSLSRQLGIEGEHATVVRLTGDGSIWIGTRTKGVIQLTDYENLDSVRYHLFDTSSGMNDNHVWDVVESATGEIWIGTESGGINILSKGKFHFLTTAQGLSTNQIFRLFRDREDNLWIGSYGKGLIKFLGDHFTHYGMGGETGEFNISALAEDNQGMIWMGSYGRGLIRLDPSSDPPSFRFISEDQGLAENNISSLAAGPDGQLWIGYSMQGIGRLTPDGIEHFTRESAGLASNSVNGLLLDSHGDLWVGTNGGITLYRNGEAFSLDESSGLPSNKIRAMIEDRSGTLWVGTLKGLLHVELPSTITIYDQEEGLNDLMIHSLVEDRLGNIWIGTFGGGIYKFNRQGQDSIPIQHVAGEPALSSNNINSMAFQNDSILLVGSEKGMDRILLNRDQQVVAVKSYDASNGFTGVETNLNALLKDKDGNFWFGTTFGLTKYDPRLERINKTPPKTFITGIRIRYEEVDWKERGTPVRPWFSLPVDPVLKWSENRISFTYAGISLSNPEKIHYKYRLEGLDKEWSPLTSSKQVIFLDLDPGRYEFQVISGNENGIWSEEPARFPFTIHPPFWKRWWFTTFLILFLLTMSFLLIRMREIRLVKRNRELESKVRERTREINEQKEEIEAQRDEIEAQRDEIEKQRDIVVSQNQEIKDSIHYAERIQKAILPHEKYMEAVMPEYFVIYKPRDIVSGDFYWVKEIGNQLIIVAADCTGHGIPGAFMSMLGITLLNDHIGTGHLEKPGELLSILRLKVKAILAQEGKLEEQKDGMDMALAILDGETRVLRFSGAYNPLYLIRKMENGTAPFKGIDTEDGMYRELTGDGYRLVEIKGDRQPIGIHSMESDFTSHTLTLEPGDSFYLFSDGYLDQFGGSGRKKFKSLNFKKLLLSLQDEPLLEQKKLIEKAFEEWKGVNEQIDDICILGVKV